MEEINNYLLKLLLVSFLSILILGMLLYFMQQVSHGKCINTAYEEVEVTVVDKHYRSTWMQPVKAGKVTTFITHAAKWNIVVEYNDKEYVLEGKDTYERYGDKIGQTAIGALKIETYEDGEIKQEVVSLR